MQQRFLPAIPNIVCTRIHPLNISTIIYHSIIVYDLYHSLHFYFAFVLCIFFVSSTVSSALFSLCPAGCKCNRETV